MSRIPAIWIVVLSHLAFGLASPIYGPQFLSGGTGRNIRHLPCVSLSTGETGVCMFAFTCVKSNGTHLGTCIDRFYFGSCCKLSEDTEIHPQDNTIEDASAASSFITTESTHDSNDIPDYFTRPKPIAEKKPEASTLSTNDEKTTTKQQTRTSTKRPTTTMTTTTTTTRPTARTTTLKTTSHKIATKRPTFFSTPYTTTQPPIGLSTFQTLHDYSHGSGSSKTPSNSPISTIRPTTLPNKNVTRTETTTITTANGSSSRPGSIANSGTNGTLINPTITKKPTTASTTKGSTTTTTTTTTTTRRPIALTTERPFTRFPPRNATTTRPQHTTNSSTRKPIQHSTRRPTATTKRPSTGATRRPITTSKPSVVSTTRPIFTTAITSSTSIKVTQTNRPSSLTSTQETPTTLAAKPLPTGATSSGGSTQRPIIKRPVTITSKPEKIITTLRTTTARPVTNIARPRPSSKPTKISAATSVRPATLITSPRPEQTSTERIETSTIFVNFATNASTLTSVESSTPKPTSARPKPTEKPHGRPAKPSKPMKPFYTTLAPSSTASTTTQASTNPVTSLMINDTTLANEILPPKIPGSSSTTDTIGQTTRPSGFVTWSSNSDDDVTRAPEISSSTSGITQQASTEAEWSPVTTPDGWIMIQSPTTEKTTTLNDGDATKPETTKIPVTSVKPSSESATTESTITPRPTIPALLSTIATVTAATDLPVPIETLNMTDYNQVCGRRLFPESRIVGGDHSSFGKWPWQISLRQWRTAAYLHKCGAALLNENWAITAAHCVENVPPSDLLLRIGEHDLANEDEPYGFQERRVQIVASHPQFDPRTFEYDLALLRFYEPVLPFQPNLLPICLPDDDENYVGHTAYVTGWGRLYEDGPLPSVLQEVSVPVVNNTVCEGMYRNAGYIEHIPHIFICAGWRKGGFDSCEGDSGGPMVIQRPRDKRWILAGVISWGIGCAEPNQPGVYTRISEFREWINQILQF